MIMSLMIICFIWEDSTLLSMKSRGKSELPVFAIELDGKEHFEDEVVRERDRQKNEICKAHHMQIIRVENSYARRYHYIKEILNDYFAKAR